MKNSHKLIIGLSAAVLSTAVWCASASTLNPYAPNMKGISYKAATLAYSPKDKTNNELQVTAMATVNNILYVGTNHGLYECATSFTNCNQVGYRNDNGSNNDDSISMMNGYIHQISGVNYLKGSGSAQTVNVVSQNHIYELLPSDTDDVFEQIQSWGSVSDLLSAFYVPGSFTAKTEGSQLLVGTKAGSGSADRGVWMNIDDANQGFGSGTSKSYIHFGSNIAASSFISVGVDSKGNRYGLAFMVDEDDAGYARQFQLLENTSSDSVYTGNIGMSYEGRATSHTMVSSYFSYPQGKFFFVVPGSGLRTYDVNANKSQLTKFNLSGLEGKSFYISKSYPNTWYVGTRKKGVFVTTDAGKTWSNIMVNSDFDHGSEAITSITKDPFSKGAMLFGTPQGIYSVGNVDPTALNASA